MLFVIRRGYRSERSGVALPFKHTRRRRHWFRYTGLCALAWLAATRPAIAVDPRQPAADYLRQTFTTEYGLPSNVVNDVLQTRDGFLIVGAQATSPISSQSFTLTTYFTASPPR
jgi:hypothetical protein